MDFSSLGGGGGGGGGKSESSSATATGGNDFSGGNGDGGFSPLAAVVIAGIFGVLILGLALIASMNRRS